MSDAEASNLYLLLIAVPLVVALVMVIVLSVLHVLALHGRRLLPERLARVAGWLVFGLTIGVTTQLMSTDAMTWLVAAGVAAFTINWAWREGRLRDTGLALIGGALPWLVNVGLFVVIMPPDPTVPVVDIRFLIVVGALMIAGIGVLLVIGAPRTARAQVLTPLRRTMLVPSAINHAQAMGPVSAPLVLAFVAGMTGGITVLVLGQDLAPILRQLILGGVFIGLTVGTWWVATPRRVTDAQDVIRWLVDAERRMWAERLGRPMPRTPRGIRRLLASLSDRASLRPLRIEVLATDGHIGEARNELANLPLETAEERAVAAELAEYVDWYDGKPEGLATDRWVRELPAIEDPDTRLRLGVSLALSRARRAAAERDPSAIDHLVAMRPQIDSVSSRLWDPATIGIVGGFVLVGILGFMAIPLLGVAIDGVQ